MLASDYKNGLAADTRANPAVPLAGEHPMILEGRHILRLLDKAATAAGTSLANAVRIDQFPTSRTMVDSYHVERRAVIHPPRPASTSVVVSGLMVPACNTEVELVCIIPEPGFEKEGINTDKIPQPLGGYAPAIRAGDFIFVAGQVPSDFVTGLAPEARVDPNFWEGNPIDKQARYTLENIKLTLEAAGSSLDNVVKAGIYLRDINDVPRLDRVWREYFPTDPPARMLMPVDSVVVPDARLEITLVALRDGGTIRKEVIHTDRAPEPIFHESQAVRAGDIVFLSSQVAADQNGLVAQAHINPHYPFGVNSPAEQMRKIMEHAQAICHAADTDLRHALRLLTMHTDLHDFAYAADIRRGYFPDGQPTTTTVGVSGPLAVPGCTIAADLWVGMP
jgi:enamine deaminase RidA (YjgF/YER057c/UK114 family)